MWAQKIKFGPQLATQLKRCVRLNSQIAADSFRWSKCGGRYLVTMMPGIGIGPELAHHVQEIFLTASAPVDFELITPNPSDQTPEVSDQKLIDFAVTSMERNGVGLKANMKAAPDDEYDLSFVSHNIELRDKLDLFVYVIHCKSYPNVRAKFPDLDLVLIKQNTEGEYSMLEHESVAGVVESMKITSETNISRVVKWAFKYADAHKRKKITIVHKETNFQLSDRMFLENAREVAKNYPNIEIEDQLVDTLCNRLVRVPHDYDVLLMPNLYGTVIANIICGLAGGPGLHVGRNYGDQLALFEPATRQTGRILTGKNSANPVSMIMGSVYLLEFLGEKDYANLIRDAVHKTVCEDQILTPDVGGAHTTIDVVNNIKIFINENFHKYRRIF